MTLLGKIDTPPTRLRNTSGSGVDTITALLPDGGGDGDLLLVIASADWTPSITSPPVPSMATAGYTALCAGDITNPDHPFADYSFTAAAWYTTRDGTEPTVTLPTTASHFRVTTYSFPARDLIVNADSSADTFEVDFLDGTAWRPGWSYFFIALGWAGIFPKIMTQDNGGFTVSSGSSGGAEVITFGFDGDESTGVHYSDTAPVRLFSEDGTTDVVRGWAYLWFRWVEGGWHVGRVVKS